MVRMFNFEYKYYGEIYIWLEFIVGWILVCEVVYSVL